MNGAHQHLLLNHIPVFTTAFGLLALLWALSRKSKDMLWAAVVLFVVAGISAWLASETGESAEKIVEHLPGVTKALIHEHEEAAEAANVSAALLAVGSLILIAIDRFRAQFLKPMQILLLMIALVSTALMARAAYLGGQISHSEIRGESPLEAK